MDGQIKSIEERLEAATPDLSFFVSLGGQLCANFPRGLWADEQQVRSDTVFHNHASEDTRYLLADIVRLQGENEMYRQAFGEIQATSIMSSSMSAWQCCLAIADKAMNGEFVYPNRDKLARMEQERDNATELLRAWAGFDWTKPLTFDEWQKLVYSLTLHLQQYSAKNPIPTDQK